MKYYIKYIASIEHHVMEKVEDNQRMPRVKPTVLTGEKYRVWDFFLFIFFIFYRTKIATEPLWLGYYDIVPSRCDYYNLNRLKRELHIFTPFGNNVLYYMPYVIIKFSDGSSEIKYFDSDEDANNFVDDCIDKYSLKEYKKYE